MAASTPKSKTQNLICQLNDMIISGNVNEFTLRRCKAEAAKVKEVDLPDYFCLLGMIACIEEDDENMHAKHKNSILYSGNDPHYLAQYGVSLMNRKLFERGYGVAKEALEKDPLNEEALNLMIKAANCLGKEEDFSIYTAKWHKLKGERHPLIVFPEDNNSQLLSYLNGFDGIIDACPSLIHEPDPALIQLADELTQGVDLT